MSSSFAPIQTQHNSQHRDLEPSYLYELMAKPVTTYCIRTGSHPNHRGGFLLAMSVLAATCALECPVDAAAESAMQYAVFDRRAGTLELVFDVPPAYGNLTLRPDGADSFLAYNIAEYQNVLDLNTEALGQFRGMVCPTLHVGAGSFVDSHGDPIGNHAVPLWVDSRDGWTLPRPGVDASCTLTFMIVEPPPTQAGTLLNAVHDGLRAWSEMNPGLELRYVGDGTANVNIEFAELGSPSVTGEACVECLYTFADERAFYRHSGELVDTNRSAVVVLNYLVSDYNALRNAAAHEFGHNLGLGHHQDPNHLMYTDELDFQSPYDDLGYDIPKRFGGNSSMEFEMAMAAPVVIATVMMTIRWWVYKSETNWPHRHLRR